MLNSQRRIRRGRGSSRETCGPARAARGSARFNELSAVLVTHGAGSRTAAPAEECWVDAPGGYARQEHRAWVLDPRLFTTIAIGRVQAADFLITEVVEAAVVRWRPGVRGSYSSFVPRSWRLAGLSERGVSG